jgi:FkbH-like protein
MNELNILSEVKDPFLYKKDYLDIQSLINNFNKIRSKNKKIKFKKNINISISSDYTSNYLTQFLPVFFANKKINVKIYEKEFGSLNFLSKEVGNIFWRKNTDFFILIPSSRNLNLPLINDRIIDIKNKAKKDAEIWLRLWNSTNKKIIDVENLVFRNEKANWNDTRMYNLTKQPFSMETIPILSNYICNAALGMLGISKKVIVVDLDNTLWGGIIGDDGFNNIVVGPETPEGEAFQNFQRYLKQLTEKGIVLCICSKNKEEIAKEAFLKNKNMILELNNIAIFKANYLDKATNIKNISKTLNLGLDSIIFVDDSRFECEQVKKNLPEVLTLNLPDDPSDFIKLVDDTSGFYFNNITKEDISRIASYKKLLKIDDDIKSSKNIDDFLKSIKSKVILEKTNSASGERASQLLGKTNQFKFNSKTFLAKELIKEKNSFCIFYEDKYQNYGNIGVVVYKIIKKDCILIENWVLSCRVFSRKLEHFIIQHLVKLAKKNNCKNIIFKFEKTKKNLYLQEFLNELRIDLNKKSQTYKISIEYLNLNKLNNYIKLK